jgi:urease accessory protein
MKEHRRWATSIRWCSIGIFWTLPIALLAHTGEGVASGFASGFLHPLGGLDHVVAMVAVGLWGGILGPPSLWVLPVTFPTVMAVGGVLGILGLLLPGIEIGIALSAVVLGVMVAAAARLPMWGSGALVGAFAIFHGYAHGIELPAAADPLAYGVGFVIATGLLHLAGITVGLLVRWQAGRVVVRLCGVVVSAIGAYFLLLAVRGGA